MSVDVLSVAASAPSKQSGGPTMFVALRESVVLPVVPTVGTPAPELIAQLVARQTDATPYVVVCERSALARGSDRFASPLAVLNDRNIARHAIGAKLAADEKLPKAQRMSSEQRDALNAERKAQSKRCTEYRADVTARVLMAYTAADEAAAAKK